MVAAGESHAKFVRTCTTLSLHFISIVIICTAMTDTFGFQLSDVSRLMRRRFDERARLIGVTRTQWRTLTTLSRNEGMNQGGLAELLEVEPITLCRMIDRLEEADLVERRRDPQDRRAWRIYLTEKARPLIVQLRVIADGLFEDALDGIDAAAREALRDTLDRIRDNLNSADQNETAHG
jgi:DNA-binding MarR family transcriptional regulator